MGKASMKIAANTNLMTSILTASTSCERSPRAGTSAAPAEVPVSFADGNSTVSEKEPT